MTPATLLLMRVSSRGGTGCQVSLGCGWAREIARKDARTKGFGCHNQGES